MVSDRVAFWLGNANEGTIRIYQIWGDVRVIESLFGIPADQSIRTSSLDDVTALSLLHPFDSLQSIGEEDRRLRNRWVGDIAGDEYEPTLVQEYPISPNVFEVTNQELGGTAIAREAISRCRSVQLVDGRSVSLSGCVFAYPTPQASSESVLGEASSTLHLVNNKLSVATMSLDLISFRLKSLPDNSILDAINESSETARGTLMDCGKMIREKLATWKR